MTFNFRMVTLARDAVGLTQTALAHQVGVSQAFISKIENGLETPTDELLERFADACDVPAAFFQQEEQTLGEGLVDLYHKKRLTLPVKPLKKANATANICRLEAVRLLHTVDFEDATPFPEFTVDEFGSPEHVAHAVRALWRIPAGPLPDLVSLIEATGVPIYSVDLGHDKLFAMSMPGTVGRHVIVVNNRLSASTQRFALAHELGHLTMHNGLSSDEMEREADRFAGALLMPREDIKHDLRGLRFSSLGNLKMKWRVAMSGLIYRAHEIGAVDERRYRNLNIQLSTLPGGRRHEPGEFPAEEPRLLRHILGTYEESFGYTREELERLMVVTPARLSVDYFGEQAVRLKPVAVDRHLHSVSMPK